MRKGNNKQSRTKEGMDATYILFLMDNVLKSSNMTKHLTKKERIFLVKKMQKMCRQAEQGWDLHTTDFADSWVWWNPPESKWIPLAHDHLGLEVIE